MNKRLLIAILTGAILGVFCIMGATTRSTEQLESWYLLSFWFNRVIMGLLFALLPLCKNVWFRFGRGLLFGLFVSFAFYSATAYSDLLGFLAGGMYGIIIEFVLYQYDKRVQKTV